MIISVYSAVDPGLCPGELLSVPGHLVVVLLPDNPSSADFASTADVALLFHNTKPLFG